MRATTAALAISLLSAAFGVAALAPAPATAQQEAAARDGRTVEWYGRNPYLRMRVLDQCANDPGRLRNHPDCINAQRADLADAARRLLGDYQGSPNSPEWFSHHPEIRKGVIGRCRHMKDAEARRQYYCEQARQSIINDQLRLTGRLPSEVEVR